jgi:hypothetical protein
MKSFARLSLMGSGLGLIFLTAVPSFATVLGTLTVGGTGTVTVTPLGITFTENDPSGGSAAVGGSTTLSYTGGSGSLTVGQPIDITGTDISLPNFISPTTLPATLTFPDEPGLTITLDTFGPGSLNTDCSGLAVGGSCSPETPSGASPIILTDAGPHASTAILFVSGTATDGTTTSDVSGDFSANISTADPATLAGEASFSTTYSGSLSLTAISTVPEPRTISLVAFLGLLMGLVVKRRKSSEA